MKNSRRLAINMISNIISFVVNFIVSFFITPYVINNVGSAAYSFIPISNDFVNYINILTTALNSMASRFITIEINSNKIDEANEDFNSVLVANTIISIILTIPSILVILCINNILNIPPDLLYDVRLTFMFVAINMLLALIGNVFSVATYCKNRLELSAKRTIYGNIIRAVVILLLFTLLKPKIYFITVTTLIVTLYTIYANIKYTKELLPEVKLNIKKFKVKSVKKLLSSGIWNSLNQLSSVLISGLDLFIANVMVGAGEAGEFSIVKTIPNFLQAFIAMLVGVFVPQFTILYAKEEKEELVKNIELSIKIMGAIIAIPLGFLIVFGKNFYNLWVPGQNIDKLQILSILTIVPLMVSGSINTLFNVFTVTNKLKLQSIVSIFTGICNVAIVFILLKVTNLGIYAIPLVSAITCIIKNLTFTPIYAAKCLNIKWYKFYLGIFKGIGCTIIMILVCFIIRILFVVNSWTTLILAGVGTSVVALFANLLVVFDKNEIRSLITKIKQTLMEKSKNS